MWHLLLAVAVAGSTGFVTKHFLTPRNNTTTTDENADLHNLNAFVLHESESGSTSQTQHRDGVFTFSSSKSPTQDGPRSRPKSKKSRASRNGVRVSKVEDVRLKKRKTVKNVSSKAPVCSSKENSLFGWGMSFGIICMMSAGKAEINKLNKTMDETVKLLQELKSEHNRRKLSCAPQNFDSVGNCKANDRHEVMLNKTNSELRHTGVKIWSPGVNDSGECGSSALTEEPEPQGYEMDQLEAELELELQKLSGCTIDSTCHEEIKPKLDELENPEEGYHGTDDWNLNYSKSHAVSASELHHKLNRLLIEQQENQIMELESELNQAQSNLHEKEAELQALKDCVNRLTELSLSTVSDDETLALTDSKGTNGGNNNMNSESKPSVVRTKRPLDSESCSYYM
ncbi:hypothetical protein VNO77_16199 [Canavalia gladiata]|uniref:Uncharacterized protein n=1 Tax=Canavalia gladiata TaxID=3824 RepID=A0AAN9M5F4_CANGL